jgi:hypothetical protein
MKHMKPKVPAAVAARPTHNTSANVTNMRGAYDKVKALASVVFFGEFLFENPSEQASDGDLETVAAILEHAHLRTGV